jgi:hypothetical protein
MCRQGTMDDNLHKPSCGIIINMEKILSVKLMVPCYNNGVFLTCYGYF